MTAAHPGQRMFTSELPGINFLGERVDGSKRRMPMSMHRQAFPLFPPAHGRHIAVQISRDFFPGVEPSTVRRVRGRRRTVRVRFGHVCQSDRLRMRRFYTRLSPCTRGHALRPSCGQSAAPSSCTTSPVVRTRRGRTLVATSTRKEGIMEIRERQLGYRRVPGRRRQACRGRRERPERQSEQPVLAGPS